MKLAQTPYGNIKYRDKYDEAVIKEVIYEDNYRRWGGLEIHKGDLVIDCGGHIGCFTKIALALGAEVMVVEPHPGNFALLKENIGNNDNALLFNKAVANEPEVNFYIDENRNELHKIDSRANTKVPAISLDELIGENIVNFLKMDIEGAEYEVLYHSKKMNQIDQISLEYHGGMDKLGELLVFLHENNFRFGWIGGQDFGHLQAVRRR